MNRIRPLRCLGLIVLQQVSAFSQGAMNMAEVNLSQAESSSLALV